MEVMINVLRVHIASKSPLDVSEALVLANYAKVLLGIDEQISCKVHLGWRGSFPSATPYHYSPHPPAFQGVLECMDADAIVRQCKLKVPDLGNS